MTTPWHLGFEAEDRLELFGQSEARLRASVRALARVAGPAMLLFCIVDDHVHAVVFCDRERAGRLARSILLTLKGLAAVPLRPSSFIKRVENRGHLSQLVRYCIEQPAHHKLKVHSALWTGSCFQDLIGARAVGALGVRLETVLPRFNRVDLLTYAGLPPRELMPTDDKLVRSAGARRLARAAAAALAAEPDLRGHRLEVEQARAAACVLAAAAGMATRETAAALDVALRTVQRLAHSAPDAVVLRSVRMRLALEDAVASLPPPPR